jgi:hypothetical protein
MNDENHDSSPSVERPDSKCATERRYHEINSSGQHCTNSPQRYQNYFEILQSVPGSIQESLANRPRYSPTHDSSHKLASQRSILGNQKL